MTADDLPIVEEWLAQPHVRDWYEDWDPKIDATVARQWIVSFRGAPFGFIQDYRIGDFEDHPLAALPPDARGIDQFIGPLDMLHKGHGPAFIRSHVATLLAEGAPAVGTDPDPENTRAIRAYSKAGFLPLGPALVTKWGPALPMAFQPNDQ